MQKRKYYDPQQPGAQALRESIVHGAAITEGMMVAFQTCFPNVSEPVRADESFIRALDITPDGIVYAGTSGYAVHLLVFMFHGITGMVFDLGTAEGATECTAICCGKDSVVAAVNGPAGARLVQRELQPLPFDLIQEWHLWRKPFKCVDVGGRILHAVTDAERSTIVGMTRSTLFTYALNSGELRTVAEVPGAGRIARSSSGAIFGRDGAEHLWKFDPHTQQLTRQAVQLPPGDWNTDNLIFARDDAGAVLYLADNRSRLFRFHEQTGFSAALGTIPLVPVGAMAVTRDGRLFISAGDGIARMFCYHPRRGTLSDLGVAVSVLERRRYGYCFGDAVCGRDGELIFGENDDLGHLWLYFPKIEASSL